MSIHAPSHCGPPARPVCAMRTPNGTPQSSHQPLPASRNPRLLAVIATVVIASVGVGVVVAQFIGGAREGLPTAAASSEPSVTLTTTVEPTATDTQEAQTPTPSPSPTAKAIAILANGAIASVSVDALNLRQSADASSASLASLTEGTELFVIGQPQDDGDLRWYRVAVGPFADGPCTDTCVDAIGWVATPATGEDRWIEEAEVACPASPVTVDQLTAITRSAVSTASVAPISAAPVGLTISAAATLEVIVFEPAWLAWPPSLFFRASDFYTTLYYARLPGPGEDWASVTPVAGDIVQFTGHFDDPAAPDCHAEFRHGADTTDLTLPDDAVIGLRLPTATSDHGVRSHRSRGRRTMRVSYSSVTLSWNWLGRGPRRLLTDARYPPYGSRRLSRRTDPPC